MRPGKAWFLFLGMAVCAAQAEEKIWLKNGGKISGKVQSAGEQVQVSWPYGSVQVPASQVGQKPAPQKRPSPPPKAWTEGSFVLRYELVREGPLIRVQKVQVKVKNNVCFAAHPSDRLKAHEDVHRLINNVESKRIQRELASFQTTAQGRSNDLKDAEKLFRRKFHRHVQQVRKLHQDWDANHTVP